MMLIGIYYELVKILRISLKESLLYLKIYLYLAGFVASITAGYLASQKGYLLGILSQFAIFIFIFLPFFSRIIEKDVYKYLLLIFIFGGIGGYLGEKIREVKILGNDVKGIISGIVIWTIFLIIYPMHIWPKFIYLVLFLIMISGLAGCISGFIGNSKGYILSILLAGIIMMEFTLIIIIKETTIVSSLFSDRALLKGGIIQSMIFLSSVSGGLWGEILKQMRTSAYRNNANRRMWLVLLVLFIIGVIRAIECLKDYIPQ